MASLNGENGERDRRSLRILVAEDNPVNQLVVRRLLEREGHAVVVAGTGMEAVDLADKEAFDLVLMDVQMPEMSGFDATRLIRQRERSLGRRTPIIAVTAHVMKGYRERCFEAGMDGYVTKPIDLAALFRAIESALGPKDGPSVPDAPAGPSPVAIDRKALLDRVDNDRDLLSELIRLFREDCPKLVSGISDAIARGDAPGVDRGAHTLKGSVGNFCAYAAFEAARELEMLGKSGQIESCNEALAILKAELAKVDAELREISGGEGPAQPEEKR